MNGFQVNRSFVRVVVVLCFKILHRHKKKMVNIYEHKALAILYCRIGNTNTSYPFRFHLVFSGIDAVAVAAIVVVVVLVVFIVFVVVIALFLLFFSFASFKFEIDLYTRECDLIIVKHCN